MISVVLVASEDLPGLAAQMAMLVPAAVDGLVKEVVLVADDDRVEVVDFEVSQHGCQAPSELAEDTLQAVVRRRHEVRPPVAVPVHSAEAKGVGGVEEGR